MQVGAFILTKVEDGKYRVRFQESMQIDTLATAWKDPGDNIVGWGKSTIWYLDISGGKSGIPFRNFESLKTALKENRELIVALLSAEAVKISQ